jgi:succinyl-CoA synthetase alpha subunit
MEKVIIRKKTYHDSAFLMRLARQLEGLAGVDEAVVLMGTEMNCKLVTDAGFTIEAIADVTPMDMIIALRGKDAAALDGAEQKLSAALAGGGSSVGLGTETKTSAGALGEMGVARSTTTGGLPKVGCLKEAFETFPDINLVSVAVPGRYAGYVSERALVGGRNVFLFSDNVSLADEVRLKQEGIDQGLLVMGPDCGTAIIDGVGLGFANRVKRGKVGIVGASGTGIQEITCGLDAAGRGVSQAIGTGSRDLGEAVDGMMTVFGLDLLEADPQTAVCVLVAKHPHTTVAARIHQRLLKMRKPTVVRYLGQPPPERADMEGCDKVFYTQTLDHAVAAACALAAGKAPTTVDLETQVACRVSELKKSGLDAQSRLLGLFGGGSLAAEARLTLTQASISTHMPEKPLGLKPPLGEGKHLIVDVGEDFYTVGRPHPMIDGAVRCDLIRAAGGDESIGLLLFDVVLGDGAQLDPAPELAAAVRAARETRATSKGRKDGGESDRKRPLVAVASVSGTAADPQDVDRQRTLLAEAGVFVEPTAARAARLTADVLAALSQQKGDW